MVKKAKEKRTLVLLDAHAIIHRAYHALPGFATHDGRPTGALYGLVSMLIKIYDQFDPYTVVAAYDLPEPTFRHEQYKAYKAGRKKAEEDLVAQLESSRELLTQLGIPIYDSPGFEADDVLGTIVEQMSDRDDVDIVIASGDMDTMQLISGAKVKVFTLKRGLNDVVLYGEKETMERFGFGSDYIADYKGLRGDPSDNIPGIPGIGEKTATTLIAQFKTIEKLYEALDKESDRFEKIGIKPRIIGLLKEHRDEAFFSKELATIKRDTPITFEMPDKQWWEAITGTQVVDTLESYEFRSLVPRYRNLLMSHGVMDGASKTESQVEEATDDEKRRATIAMWVLQSHNTSPDIEDVLLYTSKDSVKQALSVLEGELKEKKLWDVYHDIELPLVPILEKMRQRGILVDVEHLTDLSKKLHIEMEDYEKKIFSLTKQECNLNSPKQLSHVLFEVMGLPTKGIKKTPGGALSTRESELEKLRSEHEVIDFILQYREIQKLLSTYVDVIPKMVDEHSRLHSTLHQTGTSTGRMSSSDPNLQNIPAREGRGVAIRKGFIPSKGSTFVAVDYSQIEMRVLAVLSGDTHLVKSFTDGKDIHASVASQVFGVDEDKVTKDMRRKAKVINFGIIYGMGVNALKTNLNTSRKEAQTFYDQYFEAFPTISNYFDTLKRDAAKEGYTETYFGRRRYFPDMKSKIPYIRASAERMVMNAPIQGTAADLMKMAMIKSQVALSDKKLQDDAHLLLQIHDELVYEVKDAKLSEVIEVVKDAMENVASFPVPLAVTVATGKDLQSMKDITI